MRVLLPLAFALLPTIASADVCPSVQPGPTWVCVAGGWLPANQVPVPAVAAPTENVPTQTASTFTIGRTYRRDATGARIFMVSIGRASSGVLVVTAECLNESVQDQCYYPGAARLVLANANTLGWTQEN